MIRAVLLLLVGFVLAANSVAQQIQVEVVLESDTYLVNEELVVAVRITNFSGVPLKFGKDDEWLKFSVEGERKEPVPRLLDVPVSGEFVVDSARTATRRVNIAPYAGLDKPGRYRVTAMVRVEEFDRLLGSQPKAFSIVSGRLLWEQEIGLPGKGAGAPAESRRYRLIQAMMKDRPKLYFSLVDPVGEQTLKVFPLSGITSFSRPEAQVDGSGSLHVLNQYGARLFTYCSITPAGEVVARYTVEGYPSRPELRAEPDGKILVNGGTRKISSQDIPAPAPEEIEAARAAAAAEAAAAAAAEAAYFAKPPEDPKGKKTKSKKSKTAKSTKTEP